MSIIHDTGQTIYILPTIYEHIYYHQIKVLKHPTPLPLYMMSYTLVVPTLSYPITIAAPFQVTIASYFSINTASNIHSSRNDHPNQPKAK